jgi:GPH family glycoside/pentoside/hexuronide:cation symporter
MRLFYTLFPILGTLGAMYVMRKYDITEKRANEIRAELEQKNKSS